jgi:FkbM family methyltransferase
MKAIFPYEDEARLKEEFFAGRRDGFFVEVGANDPEQWSQSYTFEQRGWTGVLVEPQPALADKLKARRKAKVYAVACSSPANAGKPMRLTLAGIHSSLEASHFVFGMNREGVIEVPVTTLDQVLIDAQAPTPLDLLSIDVEGHEIDVLDGFDLNRWRPRLLLIEDLVMNLRLHRYLSGRGYKWVRRTGLNSWYVPADAPAQVNWEGRLQFLRKYYLATPFRHLREGSRRLRENLGFSKRAGEG